MGVKEMSNTERINEGANKQANLPIVLIVEDNKNLNRLIEKTLQREGFRTETALNGLDAIEKIVKDPNKLVLLDYLLPAMTAKEVLSDLNSQGIQVPCIVMTGHGDEKISLEMTQLGAVDCIIKEGNFLDNLSDLIQKVLNTPDA